MSVRDDAKPHLGPRHGGEAAGRRGAGRAGSCALDPPEKKIIRDPRDLFRLPPRGFEHRQLALQRPPLGVLIGGHFERESVHQREPRECRARLGTDPAAAPELTLGQVEGEPL